MNAFFQRPDQGSRRNWLIVCFLNVSFCIGSNLLFFYHRFSIDSLMTYYAPYQNADWHLYNGRFVFSGVVRLMDWMGADLVFHGDFFLFLLLFTCGILATAIFYAVYSCACGNEKNLIPPGAVSFAAIDLSVLLIFNSVFISEFFYFIECSLMYMIALSGAVLAAIFATKFLFKPQSRMKRAGWFILSAALITVAFSTYQAVFGLYAFLVCLFLLILSDGNTAVFRKGLRLPVIAAAMAVTVNFGVSAQLLSAGIITPDRSRYSTCISSAEDLVKYFSAVMKGQGELWITAQGMLPFGLFFLCILIMFLLLAVRSVRKRSYNNLFLLLLSAFGGCAGVFSLHIVSGNTRLCQRTVFPVFALVLLLVVLLLMTRGIYERTVAFGLTAVLLCFCFFSNLSYAKDCIVSDEKDAFYAAAVQEKIESHEEKTGTKITKLGFATDAYPDTWNWTSKKYTYDLCINGFYAAWDQIPLMNFYSGRNYEAVSVPTSYRKWFSRQNWEALNLSEQVFFEGDRAYICLY